MRRLLVTLLVAPAFAFAQTIERPTVKVGDECTYDVFDNLKTDSAGNPEKIAERRGVISSVEGERATMTWTQKILVGRDTEDFEEGAWVVDRDLNTVERNGRKFDPPYPSRFYPLSPGAERRDVKSSFQRQARDGDSTVTMDGKASSWEKATVPAGTFDVLPVTWEGWYNTSRGLQRWSGRSWQQTSYSPTTFCMVTGVYRSYRGSGSIWSDRTYKLSGYKQ